MDDQVGVMEELQENVIVENTQATQANTQATKASSNGGISRTTAAICGLIVCATCYISTINADFATQQAAIILGGVSGGVFGVAVGKRL